MLKYTHTHTWSLLMRIFFRFAFFFFALVFFWMHILAIAALLESKGETPFDIARAGEGLNKNSFLNYHLSTLVSLPTHDILLRVGLSKKKKELSLGLPQTNVIDI